MTDCIEEIKKFFNENKHFKDITNPKDKLKKFKTFDISDITDKEYSRCTVYPDCRVKNCEGCGYYDQDDTYISRLVMFSIWKNDLPDLKSIDDIGTGKKYRGETINTFNTLFKSDSCGINKFLDLNQKEDAELKNLIIEFKKDYTTIGNLMLFPNDLNNNEQSINILKNQLCHDYADLFFKEIWDNRLYEYCLNMGETNKKYFEKFKDFKDFCKVNFLEDYIDNDNGKPKIVFNEEKIYSPYFYWNKREDIDFQNKYKEFAKGYIEKSRGIIEYRANEICKKLYDILK